jgi:large subunit ribosomal protein L17
MPTPTKGPRLGGSPAHERLMLANLATSLFEHGKITTTEAKAKRLRPLAERLVTIAKRDDLAARRRVRRIVHERETFVKLFEEIAPRYVDRPGGYTRIIKTGIRKGDAAPMAIIALVEEEMPTAAPAKATRSTARKATKAEAVAALAGDDEAEATPEAKSDDED